MAWATDDDNNDDEGDGDDDDDHVEGDDDDGDDAFFYESTEAMCHGKGLGSNGGKVSRKRLGQQRRQGVTEKA